MPEQQRKPTIWNRFFVQLLIVEAMLQIGSFLVRPVITNFSVELGATLTVAGFIVGVSTLVAMLLRPISGLVSDRMSKKRLLVISAAVFTIGAFGMAFSTTPFMIGAFHACQGLAIAFKSVCVASLAAIAVPQTRIGSAIGLIGLMNTLAMAVAPAAGTAISAEFGYAPVFLVSAIMLGIGFVLAVFYRPAPTSLPQSAKSMEETQNRGEGALQTAGAKPTPGKLRRLVDGAFYLPTIPYAIIVLFAIWPHAAFMAMTATVTDMGYLESGPLYFTVFALCALASRPFAGRLSDSLGMTAVALPGLLLAAVAVALLVFFPSAPFVVLAGIGMGVGQSAARSALEAESVRGVDMGHLGRASNTFYIGMDLGTAASPIVSGALLQMGNPQLMFASLAASCAIAALLTFFVYLKRGGKRKHRSGKMQQQ